MLGFAMWTGAYAMVGFEIVRLYVRMKKQESKTAFEPEPVEDTTGQVRRLRAKRPCHVDLTETDLRKW